MHYCSRQEFEIHRTKHYFKVFLHSRDHKLEMHQNHTIWNEFRLSSGVIVLIFANVQCVLYCLVKVKFVVAGKLWKYHLHNFELNAHFEKADISKYFRQGSVHKARELVFAHLAPPYVLHFALLSS